MTSDEAPPLDETPLQIAEFRWIKERSPNGVITKVYQYRLVNTDKWHDILKSGVTRKLEWN